MPRPPPVLLPPSRAHHGETRPVGVEAPVLRSPPPPPRFSPVSPDDPWPAAPSPPPRLRLPGSGTASSSLGSSLGAPEPRWQQLPAMGGAGAKPLYVVDTVSSPRGDGGGGKGLAFGGQALYSTPSAGHLTVGLSMGQLPGGFLSMGGAATPAASSATQISGQSVDVGEAGRATPNMVAHDTSGDGGTMEAVIEGTTTAIAFIAVVGLMIVLAVVSGRLATHLLKVLRPASSRLRRSRKPYSRVKTCRDLDEGEDEDGSEGEGDAWSPPANKHQKQQQRRTRK